MLLWHGRVVACDCMLCAMRYALCSMRYALWYTLWYVYGMLYGMLYGMMIHGMVWYDDTWYGMMMI